MPTSVTHASTGPLVGTGATNQVFPFDFEAISADEIEVLLNGVVVSPSNYTVTLNGNKTGSITAKLAGSVIIQSAPNFRQEANFDRFGPYFPDQIVPPLDKLAKQDLWLLEQIERAVKVPAGETGPSMPSLASRISKMLGTDAAGDIIGVDRSEFKGDKGDPGGNAMSIGLFTSSSTLSIALGTDLVRTSGYSAVGQGSALYVYDAAVNSAFVTANPRRAFITANGRGFKLSTDQAITPAMFGAISWNPPQGGVWSFEAARTQIAYGCPDSTDALNAFWKTLVENNGYRRADVSGYFGASSTVYIGIPDALGTTNYNREGASIRGVHTLLALAGMEKLCVVRNMILHDWSSGGLWGCGLGTNVWSTRSVAYGLVFEDENSYLTVGIKRAAGFAANGIVLNGGTGNGAKFLNMGIVRAYACGSGPVAGDSTYAQTATWSAPVNSGSANSTSQRTQLNVTADIPTYLDQYFEPSNPQAYCRINDRLYQIRNYDRVAHTISIYPWLENAMVTAATGTLEYIFGGGFMECGGDAGRFRIGVLSATVCSAGYNTHALYPATIDCLTTQHCTIGVLYRGMGGSQLGGVITDGYFETNHYDIVAFNAAGFNNSCTIVSANPVTLSKILTPGRWSGDPAVDSAGLHLGSLRILNANNMRLLNSGTTNNGAQVDAGDRMLSPFLYHGNTLTVSLIAFDLDRWRLTRNNRVEAIITGTGAGNAPTGTITFTPPAGKTINGGAAGASATYSALTASLKVIVEADPVTGNFTIRQI